MKSEDLRGKKIKSALDNALDIFGPRVKDSIFTILEDKLSFDDKNYDLEKIKRILKESMGKTASDILINRVEQEIRVATPRE